MIQKRVKKNKYISVRVTENLYTKINEYCISEEIIVSDMVTYLLEHYIDDGDPVKKEDGKEKEIEIKENDNILKIDDIISNDIYNKALDFCDTKGITIKIFLDRLIIGYLKNQK